MENQLQMLNGTHDDKRGARAGSGSLPVRSLAIAAFGALTVLLPGAAHAQGWPAPVAPLPELATALDKRFQPAIDFDTDVCFNV
ncbi:hypothetical protein GY976_24335, partial [Escherichia coli]|nr:hypothetical protein [Escherichia coli]